MLGLVWLENGWERLGVEVSELRDIKPQVKTKDRSESSWSPESCRKLHPNPHIEFPVQGEPQEWDVTLQSAPPLLCAPASTPNHSAPQSCFAEWNQIWFNIKMLFPSQFPLYLLTLWCCILRSMLCKKTFRSIVLNQTCNSNKIVFVF